MPWLYQICIIKFLSENVANTIAQEYKKPTSGWRASIKNVCGKLPLKSCERLMSGLVLSRIAGCYGAIAFFQRIKLAEE